MEAPQREILWNGALIALVPILLDGARKIWSSWIKWIILDKLSLLFSDNEQHASFFQQNAKSIKFLIN